MISSSAGQREVFVFLRQTESSRIIKSVRLARLRTIGQSKLEARDKLTLALLLKLIFTFNALYENQTETKMHKIVVKGITVL